MKKQTYKNHIRYYLPHHYVFYPLAFICTVASVVCIFKYPEYKLLWIAISILFVLMLFNSFMMRQHYALGNQNRIIRLELRRRYYQLTHERMEVIEDYLSFSQLAALRFASDNELPQLIRRALKEHLSPDEIKKSIQNWLPDYMRV